MATKKEADMAASPKITKVIHNDYHDFFQELDVSQAHFHTILKKV